MPAFPRLEADLRADVCVVGAGIAGLSAAYLLGKAGKRVVVVDKGPVAGGMTRYTSGHLSRAIDDRYFEVERLRGTLGAYFAAQSHGAAIDAIESIVGSERIDCDFERLDGYLFLAEDGDRHTLLRELAAAKRAGVPGVELTVEGPYPSFHTGPCLRFPRLAQFHPLKYAAGLARAIDGSGGRIRTGTDAESIDGGPPARVTCGAHSVVADAVIVATNAPVNDRLVVHAKQAPHLTFVIAAPVPRGSVPAALAWDTGAPYHYVRTQPLGERDLLIVGGEDVPTGQTYDPYAPYARLEAWTRERFPMAGPVEYAWSGQVMETLDGLAYIGRNPMDADNVLIATGDSGMGLTHGTIAGLLLRDLVLRRPNPWAVLYDPSRLVTRAAGKHARRARRVAGRYAEWLRAPAGRSTADIAPGEGAVLSLGNLAKVAVYRDPEGALHQRSAACTHAGCVVSWNADAKTWDCGCHGSRYDPYGRVIAGPANRDLAPLSRAPAGAAIPPREGEERRPPASARRATRA